MSQRLTTPSRVVVGSREIRTLSIDLTLALEAGEIPSSPIVGLVLANTGESYAIGLNGSPILTGPGPYKIAQSVKSLTPGETYRLLWSWAVNSTPNQIREDESVIFCDD